jgi:hypothetical protein
LWGYGLGVVSGEDARAARGRRGVEHAGSSHIRPFGKDNRTMSFLLIGKV